MLLALDGRVANHEGFMGGNETLEEVDVRTTKNKWQILEKTKKLKTNQTD